MKRVLSGFQAIFLERVDFNFVVLLMIGASIGICLLPPLPNDVWLWYSSPVFRVRSYKTWVVHAKSSTVVAEEEQTEEYSEKQTMKPLKIFMHRVAPGDTLWSIAHKYGVDFYTVVSANRGLKNINELKIGQIVRVPNHKGIFYKVKKGDTVESIANRYKVDVEDLLSVNGLKGDSDLNPGKEIFLPGATSSFITKLLLSNYVGNGFIWPVRGRIASGFGWRINPLSRRREFHEGIDIAAPPGRMVVAARGGRVIYAGWYGGFGKTVKISHGRGWVSLYGHLSRIYVRVGWYVKAGRLIGAVGNTGYSTGPHLHFGLYRYGRAVNPFRYLR